MKKIMSVMVVLALMLAVSPAYAKSIGKTSNPAPMSGLKADAIKEINAGGQLMKRADSLMRNYSSPDTLKAAVRLYTSAGSLFDSASAKMQKLQGTKEISTVDINNARTAALRCQGMVKQIQAKLAVLAPNRA